MGDVTNLLRSRRRIRFAIAMLELVVTIFSGMELLFHIETRRCESAYLGVVLSGVFEYVR